MRHAVAGTLRSPRREVVSAFLLHHLLLSYVFPIKRWVPLLQKGAEPHSVGALLVSLPTIQTTITREEIRERTHHWVDGSTLLPSLRIVFLCVTTEGTCNLISVPVSKLVLLKRRQ